MSKNRLVVLAVVLAFSLFGCSSSKEVDTAATATPNQQNSEVDPLLEKRGFDGNSMIITDSVLYDYLKSKETSVSASATATVDPAIQKKIGTIESFENVRKYNISGKINIISSNTIRISEFNYNGGCGSLSIKLTLSTSKNTALATVSPIITTARTSDTFDITVPSNLTLVQFDQVSLYCQDQDDPISSASIK
jgi:outer membrane biogenesis lipoprotein LolB